MIKNIYKDNSGSTMVEVLVGFVILVFVLAECMAHIFSVSSDMIMKSKDIENRESILNANMYKKDADYVMVSGHDDGTSDVEVTLTLDDEKTDSANNATAVTIDMKQDRIYKYECTEANLTVFKIAYMTKE